MAALSLATIAGGGATPLPRGKGYELTSYRFAFFLSQTSSLLPFGLRYSLR